MTLDFDSLAGLVRDAWPDALFATVSGAHLYGFPSADSDIDLRGCYLTPVRELIGLRAPPETRDLSVECGGTEVELVGHEVGKYLRLMARNNGYILEQVFSPLVVHGADFLAELRPLARRCITRGCYHHYRGFLQSRLRLLEREPAKKAKSLLYAYRVVLSGVHLLETGEVQANLQVLSRQFALPFIDDLIARKQARELGVLNDLDWDWHRSELSRWERRLAEAHAASELPDEPPRDALNRFLVELRLGRPAA
ncbi:MAG TPA: nucleotidyltransferase domain-containing protein [Gemmataceae bacterium]